MVKQRREGREETTHAASAEEWDSPIPVVSTVFMCVSRSYKFSSLSLTSTSVVQKTLQVSISEASLTLSILALLCSVLSAHPEMTIHWGYGVFIYLLRFYLLYVRICLFVPWLDRRTPLILAPYLCWENGSKNVQVNAVNSPFC